MALSELKEAVEQVAEVFEADDLGAPFKVVLHNSVKVTKCEETGEIFSYSIPAVPLLLAVILISRLSLAKKLTGPEVKFARKVLGFKQSELAAKLDLSVEHLSRHENGRPMSPRGEKYFRATVLTQLCKLPDLRDQKKTEKIMEMIFLVFDDMEIKSVSSDTCEPVFHFCFEAKDEADSADTSDMDWSSQDCQRAA